MKNLKRKQNHNKGVSKRKAATAKETTEENEVNLFVSFADRLEDAGDCGGAVEPVDERPCQECQRYYFEPLHDQDVLVSQVRRIATQDERCLSRRRNRRQRLVESDSKKKCDTVQAKGSKPKREPILGCDDSHIGPYELYKNMLKQER